MFLSWAMPLITALNNAQRLIEKLHIKITVKDAALKMRPFVPNIR